MLHSFLCSEIKLCILKKKKKVNLRQAKQTTTIKKKSKPKKQLPHHNYLPLWTKYQYQRLQQWFLHMICVKTEKTIYLFFFQWLVIGLMLEKIMVPHYYRKMYWFPAALFCERLKVWRQEPKSINNEKMSSFVCCNINRINKGRVQRLTCSPNNV